MTPHHRALAARDIMVPEPVCVDPATTIRQLAQVFEENRTLGAPVVDQEGRVIGVVSKTDLIRRCTEGTPPAYLFEVPRQQACEDDELIPEQLLCVEDFMSADPVTVRPDAPVTGWPAAYCSKAKMRFQSLFMLMTVQPLETASS